MSEATKLAYREPGRQLEVVESPKVPCYECIHSAKIWQNYSNGMSATFKHLACDLRANESLKPHESPEILQNHWDPWDTKKFNDEGQCDRGERKSIKVRFWDRFWSWLADPQWGHRDE